MNNGMDMEAYGKMDRLGLQALYTETTTTSLLVLIAIICLGQCGISRLRIPGWRFEIDGWS